MSGSSDQKIKKPKLSHAAKNATSLPNAQRSHETSSSASRQRKTALIERALGLKHKLKVNESGPSPQNHKETATLMAINWDLEDEINAIDQYLQRMRNQNVQEKLLALLEQMPLDENNPS